MSTATELSTRIGQTAKLRHGGLDFTVSIVDARNRFGSIDYLVTPANGSGSTWVSSSTLKLNGGN
jgi:hypothetical protein